MPTHVYENWNKRPSDREEQIEPYRKYYFICEGANTETFYFKRLIDIRKDLNIHPLIDVRLLEKTEQDRNLSFPKKLAEFAEQQKAILGGDFDEERDRMVIVFDADIFEEKVSGYEAFVADIETKNIVGVTNPGFELFLLLHLEGAYEEFVSGNEKKFLTMDNNGRYSHAYECLLQKTGMNAKKNSRIGLLADNCLLAIEQEKLVNQDVHSVKGKVSSNIGKILEAIINDEP
ncbi:MAG: RloB family protein [Anaerovoracaceae bacterium]